MRQKFEVFLSNGRAVDLMRPDPEAFDVETIAFHLSKEQRFGNSLPTHYSVLNHSAQVAKLCTSNRLRALALLHDAAEIVTRDIPDPVKRWLDAFGRAAVTTLERNILSAVFDRFGLNPVSSAEWGEVMEADRLVFAFERRYFSLPMAAVFVDFNSPTIQEKYRTFEEGMAIFSKPLFETDREFFAFVLDECLRQSD